MNKKKIGGLGGLELGKEESFVIGAGEERNWYRIQRWLIHFTLSRRDKSRGDGGEERRKYS